MSRKLPMKLQQYNIRRWLKKNVHVEILDGIDIFALFDNLDSKLCYEENFQYIEKVLYEKYPDFNSNRVGEEMEREAQIERDEKAERESYLEQEKIDQERTVSQTPRLLPTQRLLKPVVQTTNAVVTPVETQRVINTNVIIEKCKKCNVGKIVKYGFRISKKGRIQKYQCSGCGAILS